MSAAWATEVKFLVEFVNDVAIFGVNLVLVLEGHMSNAVPLLLELFDSLGNILASLDCKSFQFFDYGLFLYKVLALLFVLIAEDSLLFVEEFVACSIKALPERVAQFVGGSTDFLPLLL